MGKEFEVISKAVFIIIPHGLPIPTPKLDLSTPGSQAS